MMFTLFVSPLLNLLRELTVCQMSTADNSPHVFAGAPLVVIIIIIIIIIIIMLTITMNVKELEDTNYKMLEFEIFTLMLYFLTF